MFKCLQADVSSSVVNLQTAALINVLLPDTGK